MAVSLSKKIELDQNEIELNKNYRKAAMFLDFIQNY